MRHIFIGILLITLISYGCKPFIKIRYGIKNPKIETPESLLGFTKTYNLNSRTIYVFKDTLSYFQSLKDSVFKMNTIGTMFFNRNGYLIDNSKRKGCQWSGCAFLNLYKKDSVYLVDSTYKLDLLAKKIIPLDGETLLADAEPDLTVISIWAKFIGKYNERLFCISDVVKNRPDLNVRIVFLNVDMLKEWNLTKDQMLR